MTSLERAAVKTTTQTVARAQRHLGPRWGWVEGVRRFALPPLDPIARWRYDRPLIRQKGPADYVCTLHCPPGKVPEIVWPTYHRNVLSTKKYRVIDGEKEWEVASWRHVPDDGEYQHHLYYFRDPDGRTDLYHHKEVAFEHDPRAHEIRAQVYGDPDGILRDTVSADVAWHRKELPFSRA